MAAGFLRRLSPGAKPCIRPVDFQPAAFLQKRTIMEILKKSKEHLLNKKLAFLAFIAAISLGLIRWPFYKDWLERNNYKPPETFQMLAYVIVSGSVAYIVICAVSVYISFRVLGGQKEAKPYWKNEIMVIVSITIIACCISFQLFRYII